MENRKINYLDFCFLFLNFLIAIMVICRNNVKFYLIVLLLVILIVSYFINFDCKNRINDIAKKGIIFFISILISCLFFCMNFKFSTNMFYDKINYIEGVLVTDSTLSKNNGSLFECLVENAQESENLNLETSSVIKIYVSKNDKRAVAGQKCSFWDVKKLEDGFWSAKDIDILNYNLFLHLPLQKQS